MSYPSVYAGVSCTHTKLKNHFQLRHTLSTLKTEVLHSNIENNFVLYSLQALISNSPWDTTVRWRSHATLSFSTGSLL